jgi:hypothetical protein
MNTPRRRLILVLTGVGLTLIALGLLPLIALAQDEAGEATETATVEAADEITAEATAEATLGAEAPVYDLNVEPITPTGDNSYCAVCHTLPWRAAVLQDGTQLNLFVNPETIANSVHGTGSNEGPLGCVDCHGEDSFPHGATPADTRSYTLNAVDMCVGCHANEARDMQLGLHEQAIMRGNTAAAVCTDCHGAHDVQQVVEEPDLIAGVCGDCHVSSLQEWQVSAHVDLGPLGCATCHSPHTQMIRAGTTPDGLCQNCHEEDMPDIWVHSQHLTETSDVGCVDCHMYPLYPPGEGTPLDGADSSAAVQLVSLPPGDRPTGHTMLLDTTPCTACHETLPADAEPVAFVEPSLEEVDLEGEPQTYNFVELLQGLILGLGFGATVAAIFVARGNRK